MLKKEVTLLVGALVFHHTHGHGQMYSPTPWQATSDCSSPNPSDCAFDLKIPSECEGEVDVYCHGNPDQTINIGADSFCTNWTWIPEGKEPTLSEDMFDPWLSEWRRKTWFSPGVYGYHPWNAPGSAPIWGNGCGVNGGNPNGCYITGDTVEVLGTCCGKPGTGDCGGYSGGKSALEHYKDGLFEDPKVTTWKRGGNEEVYWIGNGYHRGGYAYRLCRVHEGQFWRVTEECFQRGHLNFAGETSWIYWKPWISQRQYFSEGWIPVDLITTKSGTTPEGSEWAMINLPKEAGTQDNWAFKDLVEVPADLAPGDYVLSFRWDCLESPQIWSACANINIE